MRILLDECLPRKLAKHLAGHQVTTVPQAGWAGIKNGRLLKLMEPGFDVFVTADRNLSYQQNLSRSEIAMVVLGAKSNRLQDLLPVVSKLMAELALIQPGEIRMINAA